MSDDRLLYFTIPRVTEIDKVIIDGLSDFSQAWLDESAYIAELRLPVLPSLYIQRFGRALRPVYDRRKIKRNIKPLLFGKRKSRGYAKHLRLKKAGLK